MQKQKIGRNDKCYCNSNKKYKVCCLNVNLDKQKTSQEKYKIGQLKSSEKIEKLKKHYQTIYTDHTVIDISDDITLENYKPYQLNNYTSKIIMIAERNATNLTLFNEKTPDLSSDVLVMYRGSYRAINSELYLSYDNSINKMIQTRLNNEIDN